MKLTIFYDGQYWVGVVEAVNDSGLKACKQIFGAEPQDGEIMEFVRHRMLPLLESGTQTADVGRGPERRPNPKRLARQVARELRKQGVSTYAQQAMKLEWESRKKERSLASGKQKEELREIKRLRKVEKAKQKHRGR